LSRAREKETLSASLVFEFNEDKKKVCLTRLSQTANNEEFPVQDAFERKYMYAEANPSSAIPR
jgi:hypothetical protein